MYTLLIVGIPQFFSAWRNLEPTGHEKLKKKKVTCGNDLQYIASRLNKGSSLNTAISQDR